MSKADLQRDIKNSSDDGGFVVSLYNHSAIEILCLTYDLLIKYGVRTTLKDEIAKAIGLPPTYQFARDAYDNRVLDFRNDKTAFLVGVVTPYLESLSPVGFQFWYKKGSRDFVGWVPKNTSSHCC